VTCPAWKQGGKNVKIYLKTVPGKSSVFKIIPGIFLILHGLVHLLYWAQAARMFELKPGMVWPDGARIFAGFKGTGAVRKSAAIACIIATLGFIAGGTGLFAAQQWWEPVTVAAAVFSAAVFLLFWDGKPQALANKGLFAILINLAIIISLLVFRWPHL
jgi:hypothetical protein